MNLSVEIKVTIGEHWLYSKLKAASVGELLAQDPLRQLIQKLEDEFYQQDH